MSSLEILLNSPALHSLKRSQLVYHCKRHGLKASGKNHDLVLRLKDYAKSLPPDFAFPCDEPMAEFVTDDDADELSSPLKPRGSNTANYPRISEAWSIIEEDSREEENVIPSTGSKRSIKAVVSATSSFGEFGAEATPGKGNGSVGSSIKAIASSIKRAAGVGSSSLRSRKSVADLMEDLPVPPSPSPSVATEPDIPLPNTSCPDPQLGPTSIRLIASEMIQDPQPKTEVPQPHEAIRMDKVKEPMEQAIGSTTFWSYAEKRKSSLYPELPEFARLNAVTSAASLVQDGFPVSFPSRAIGMPSPLLAGNDDPEESSFPTPYLDISSPKTKQVASSILEEMNRRMGVAATSTAAATLSILDKDNAAKFTGTSVFSSSAPIEAGRFQKAHDGLFQQMDSIVNHYAARRPDVNSKKSVGKGLAPRGKKRSSLSATPAAAKRRSRASMASQRPSRAPLDHKLLSPTSSGDPGPSTTAFAMSAMDETEGGGKSLRMVEPTGSPTDLKTQDEDGDELMIPGAFISSKPTLVVQPTNAARQKIFQAKAKRRSSIGRAGMGRSSIVGNKTGNPATSRFGFLKSSAKLVKSVFGAAIGAGPSTRPLDAKTSTSAEKARSAPKPQRAAIFGSKLTTTTFTTGSSQAPHAPKPKLAKAEASGSSIGSRTDDIQLRRHITIPKGGLTKTPAPATIRPPMLGSSTTTDAPRKISAGRLTASTTQRPPLPSSLGAPRVAPKEPSGSAKTSTRALPTIPSVGTQRLANSIGPTGTSSVLKRTAASSSGMSLGSKTTRTSSLTSQTKPPSRLLAPTASSMAKLHSRVPPPALQKVKADENPLQSLHSAVEPSPDPGAALVPEAATAETLSPPSTALEAITNIVGMSDEAQVGEATEFGMAPSASASDTLTSSHSTASMGSKSGRRPRIERSKVIAKLSEKRAMDAAQALQAPGPSSSRQSAIEPFVLQDADAFVGQGSNPKPNAKRSLGAALAPAGGFTPRRRGKDLDAAVQMSAKRAMRRSEVLRRKAHASFDSRWEGLNLTEGPPTFTNEV